MTNLKALIKLLQEKESSAKRPYFLPEVWNCFGFTDYATVPTRPGEISVSPAHYYRAALEWICAQGGNGQDGDGGNSCPGFNGSQRVRAGNGESRNPGDKLSGKIIETSMNLDSPGIIREPLAWHF